MFLLFFVVPNAELISNLTCVNSNLSVFHKIDLPRRHHYVNNERIDDVMLIVNDRWQADRFEPWCEIIGNHGFDPKYSALDVRSAFSKALKCILF